MIARSGEVRGRTPARGPDVRGAARRFDEALQAARGEGRRSEGSRGATARLGERPGSPAGAAPPAAKPAPARRAGLAPAAEPREGLPAVVPPGAQGGSATSSGAPSPGPLELRAAVRALPAAVEAARLHQGAQVTLTLGAALGVDLRTGAAGVELTLRPAAALDRLAAAELPALVAALRARGVRVGRAEVQSGAGERPPTGAARQAR